MTRFLFVLSCLLFLSAPAFAQAAVDCTTPNEATTDYAQVGDDIVMVQCGADGEVCSCHAPAGENGKCRVYACNPDGSVKEPPKPKPEPKDEKPKHAAKKPVKKTGVQKTTGTKAATPAAPAPKPLLPR
jgi:hypothetical protein